MRDEARSWERKVHPAFKLGAEAFKEAIVAFESIGPDSPLTLRQEIADRLRSQLEHIWTRFPELKSPTNRLLYSWSPDSRLNDLEHLHWRRHQEPLHQALARAQADDLDALGRVNRTNSDYLAWRRLQPVKPFKIDPNHWTLFEIGFDLGLNKLSSEELADCFDAVCPCGRIHDADALKKQRARFRTAIKKVARTSPPTPLS